MSKKQKNIMVWIIVWAGLLVAVLYSPIGSPDLYSSQNYYVENRTVTTGTTVIQNAPKGNNVAENTDNGLDIPDISSMPKTTYAVNSSQSANSMSQGSGYSAQNQSYRNDNSSGANGQGQEGSAFISGGRSSRSSAASSAIVMTNGITTLSVTNDLSTNTVKQSAAAGGNGRGGTDPGGDPTSPPIPVGDGWELLVLFGVCYAAYKKRVYILSQFSKHYFLKRNQ